MDFSEIKIYDSKTMADIIKEVHNNTIDKEDKINKLIKDIEGKVETPGDAIILVPLISKYMDNSIKNNDNLIKLLGVIQRIIAKDSINDENGELKLSDVEKENLLKDVKKLRAIK